MIIVHKSLCGIMPIIPIPFFSHAVAAGFPSPADDYLEQQLDLQEYLIRHPAATFFARAQGDSMQGLGIFDGDLLIIDRSLDPMDRQIVVAALDGQLTCKILDKTRRALLSANNEFPPIAIGEFESLIIEGVVIHSVRHHVLPG